MAVYPRPRVLLAGTGDELVRPGQPLKPGQIYNSNLPQLAARCRQLGLAADTVWWPDDPRAVADGLTAGVRDFDCVITTGGVSVGDKDIFHQALPLAGAERLFWRVKLKPGTPLMFSLLEGRPVLSLSGNPFAAAATFELLARPLLAALAGQRDWQPLTLTAPLATPFSKASGGRRFVRGIYRDGAVTLPEGHSSGQLRSQVGCNCLVDIPAGSPTSGGRDNGKGGIAVNGFNHFDAQGKAIMVDVTDKAATHRVAEARGEILVNEAVMSAIQTGTAKKGDVLVWPGWRASWRSSAPATSSPCATLWRCPAARWTSSCSLMRGRWKRCVPSRSPETPGWRWRPSPGCRRPCSPSTICARLWTGP